MKWYKKFFLGALGALAPEILRLYRCVTTGVPIGLVFDWTYVIISLMFLLISGVFTMYWGISRARDAIVFGMTLPLLINTGGKAAISRASIASTEKRQHEEIRKTRITYYPASADSARVWRLARMLDSVKVREMHQMTLTVRNAGSGILKVVDLTPSGPDTLVFEVSPISFKVKEVVTTIESPWLFYELQQSAGILHIPTKEKRSFSFLEKLHYFLSLL